MVVGREYAVVYVLSSKLSKPAWTSGGLFGQTVHVLIINTTVVWQLCGVWTLYVLMVVMCDR